MPSNHREYLNCNADEFKEWAETVGKSAEEVVNHFLTSGSDPEQGYKSCVSLTKLGKRYGKKKLESTCERMLTFSSSPSIRMISLFETTDTFTREKYKKKGAKASADVYSIVETALMFSSILNCFALYCQAWRS